MKKVILFFVLILSVSSVAYAIYEKTSDTAYTPAFSARMHYCLPIIGIQPLDDGGRIVRHMIGYREHLCNYSVEEYNADNKLTKRTTCTFNQPQRVQFIQAINSDFEGTGAAKDLFETYSKDENICKVEKFEESEN